jgi:hypothetical protein
MNNTIFHGTTKKQPFEISEPSKANSDHSFGEGLRIQMLKFLDSKECYASLSQAAAPKAERVPQTHTPVLLQNGCLFLPTDRFRYGWLE